MEGILLSDFCLNPEYCFFDGIVTETAELWLTKCQWLFDSRSSQIDSRPEAFCLGENT